jgi:UDP-glucuronate 4-epimerase
MPYKTVKNTNAKKVLITGAIGFIGYHLTKKLLAEGYDVVGIDNINTYYDVKLKYDKLPILGIEEENIILSKLYQSIIHKRFKFGKIDIGNRFQIEELLKKESFDIVVNLAAQAGVQYSLKNPHTYIENNITGFINLIHAAKLNGVKHFIYASSSSVYGNRENTPFKETDNVDNPISLYAASKKSNELIAHTYSHLYGLKTTGLRFFTVYGPWGRPDMAPYKFTKAIIENETIEVYNYGNMIRDFTYVDDIVLGLTKVIDLLPKSNNERTAGEINTKLYQIYNLGNSTPIKLMEFIAAIEDKLGKKAKKKLLPIKPGDVIQTFSDVSKLQSDFHYKPSTTIKEGVANFVDWYLEYNS